LGSGVIEVLLGGTFRYFYVISGADGGARGPKIMRQHAECHRDDKNDHRQR
jgi:hypothetical protein